MQRQQARRWCFTINNPTDEEEQNLHDMYETYTQDIRFLVYQKEAGEQDTPHIQGYVEFKRPKRLNAVKSLVSGRAHCEKANGTSQQNIEYCTKEEGRLEDPVSFGSPASGQGKRTDLEKIKKELDEGATDKHLWQEYFPTMVRYFRGIAAYRVAVVEERSWMPEVYVCVGKPGTGKSKWAADNYPCAYWKQRSIWWDMYQQHETVVFDDYYGWLPFDLLLRICDRYPLMVEGKGCQIQFVAKTIIFTSNVCPSKWYRNIPNFAALIRRIKEFKVFELNDGEYMEQSFTTFEEFDLIFNVINY